MTDNQMIAIFKKDILEDFPDAEEYIEQRLRELIAANYGMRRGSHRPREWRDEFYYLALIRQELERRKKASAASDAAGMQPMQEVPETLDEAGEAKEVIVVGEVKPEDFKTVSHKQAPGSGPKNWPAAKSVEKTS